MIPASRYATPPAIAKQFGADVHRVIGWIQRGELRAINVGDGAKRPRYRISPADLAAFEASRCVQPPAPRVRRRRADPGIVQFF
jgi:hypothetical protein